MLIVLIKRTTFPTQAGNMQLLEEGIGQLLFTRWQTIVSWVSKRFVLP